MAIVLYHPESYFITSQLIESAIEQDDCSKQGVLYAMTTKKNTPRAKHKKNTIYTEDPIYNNRDYHFDWGLFGQTLKRLRIEANLTQDDLAAITGIPSAMISQFETAYKSKFQNTPKHPNQDQLVCLLRALNVDANTLFASNLAMPIMSERDRAVESLVDGFRSLIKQSELYAHYDETPGKDMTEKLANSRLYFEPWSEKSVAEKKPEN